MPCCLQQRPCRSGKPANTPSSTEASDYNAKALAMQRIDGSSGDCELLFLMLGAVEALIALSKNQCQGLQLFAQGQGKLRREGEIERERQRKKRRERQRKREREREREKEGGEIAGFRESVGVWSGPIIRESGCISFRIFGGGASAANQLHLCSYQTF